MFFKFLVVGVVCMIAGELVMLLKVGRRLAKNRSEYVLDLHKTLVALLACTSVIAFAMIEMLIRIRPEVYSPPEMLFWFHIAVVALVVVGFVALTTRFTGLKNPLVHKWLARIFIALYATVGATGLIMLYQLPI